MFSYAQVGYAPCNQMSELVNPTYSMTTTSSTNWLGSSHWNNRGNLIDSNLNNYTSWTAAILGSSWIEARENSNTPFPAGSYAGFVVGDLDLLTLGASMRVSTYLNGTLQEQVNFNTLLGSFLDGGKRNVGFETTKPFNRIRLSVNAGITFLFSVQAYYAEVLNVCEGPELECNTPTNIQQPTYAAMINKSRTGVSGINIGSVTNEQNVVDANNSNYASLTNFASILGSSYLSVKDASKTYPAGTYAGYEIENAILFGMNALNTVSIKTYLNGTLQETKSGTSLFLDVPILDGNNRRIFGFETTKSFNEVQIVVSQPFGINLGTTKVYNMVLSKPCEGADFTCNTQTIISRPYYPVNINSINTGVTGIATTLSVVEDPDKAIDNDPNSYAKITLPLTGGTIGSLAVKKSLSDFEAGTYAAFDIQNQSIFNAQFIQNTTITTYRDGVLQESATGNALFLGMGSDIIAGSGRSTLGFVTTKAFDEVRISINSIVAFNWGTTRVYGLMIMKPCPKQIDCNDSYYWNQPDFPVVLNAERTGVQSLLCAGCSVNSPGNLIDNDPNSYSRITVAAGVGNKAGISVVDPSATYPLGTFVGFTVKDRYFIVQGDLFEFITVKTYNNGVVQETKTSGDLFDLTLLIPIWGTGTKNVGFYTTQPFDEVQIVAHSLGSVVNILDVYGAFIDTTSSQGGGMSCEAEIIAVADSYTISVGNTSSTSVLVNDTIDGAPATSTNVSLSQVSSTNSGVVLDNTTGLVYVEPGTAPGNYQLVYQVCDVENLTNCETATVNVTVTESESDLQANDDSLTGPINPNGGTTTGSVLDNDTLNGNPINPANIILTQVSTEPGITLNTDGSVDVAPGTAPGNYTLTYQICEVINPSNCDTATAVIQVAAPTYVVVANDDTIVGLSTVGSTSTVSVLDNDTVNGSLATTGAGGNVTLSSNNLPTGLTLNADGTISVAPGTPKGLYEFDYTICSTEAPSVCDSATATIDLEGVADMELVMSSSSPIINIGVPLQVFYKVTNVGNESTDGSTITLTALKPQGTNTITSLVVPSGWTVSQVGNNLVFTTNNVMNVGDNDTIVVQYVSKDTIVGILRTFQGRITNGSGGEINFTNNTDSFSLLIQIL